MRIVIQDPHSNFFFEGSRWTNNEKEAMEFENVARAEEFCRQELLAGVLIVVMFNDGLDSVCYKAGAPSPTSVAFSSLRVG
jgi:hypothetical protein